MDNKMEMTTGRKESHYLWSAEEVDGKVNVRRSVAEREDWSDEEVEYAQAVNASAWGIFGASIVDDPMLSLSLSKEWADHLGKTASMLVSAGVELPEIPTWDKLKVAYGSDVIQDIRGHISIGIKARKIGKYLNVPLMFAYDVMEGYRDLDKTALRDVINTIRSEGVDEAYSKFGKVAGEIHDLFVEYSDTGAHKIAVDDIAKAYWIGLLGPNAIPMIEEVKKRVRADVISVYLKKHSVDQNAIDYYTKYYGHYGELLTKGDVSKKRL
jgi:hypothetical protein